MSLAWAVIGRRAGDRHTGWLLRLAGALRVWRERIEARRALAGIDVRTLKDAGIDPVAARYGTARPLRIAERRLR